MSKPDDIPQDIWDTAYKIEANAPERSGWKPEPWKVERCARAIQTERERNRLIARNRVDELYAALAQPLSEEAKGQFAAMMAEALLIEDRIDVHRSAASEMRALP